jgi:hypothetical protein
MKRQQGPWDQEKFEQLLIEWIVACDQPFDEVEKPEFIALMNFTHFAGGPLKIPKRDGIKSRVMKMGEETIEGICAMFMVRSHISFAMRCTYYYNRNLRERSVFPLTRGLQATSTRFWLLSHTM